MNTFFFKVFNLFVILNNLIPSRNQKVLGYDHNLNIAQKNYNFNN